MNQDKPSEILMTMKPSQQVQGGVYFEFGKTKSTELKAVKWCFNGFIASKKLGRPYVKIMYTDKAQEDLMKMYGVTSDKIHNDISDFNDQYDFMTGRDLAVKYLQERGL